jgi:integrase/recombinase XerD
LTVYRIEVIICLFFLLNYEKEAEMQNAEIDLRQAGISSKSFTTPIVNTFKNYQTSFRFESHTGENIDALRKILKRLERTYLPGKAHVEAYLRHLTRRNRRARTLQSVWFGIYFFLGMIRSIGKSSLVDITKGDVEAFVEREQDRGLNVSTIRVRLVNVYAFLRYLVEEGIVAPEVICRKIRLQLPERLPRAMDTDDLKKFLSAIDHISDRAMIMILLRTGMRIGELLNTRVMDINLKERRIEIYEGAKNRIGRVVYLSDDALTALTAWCEERDPRNEYLFYARGQRGMMSYSTGRTRVVNYFEKVGITHKGYTVHTLRHTFATELLNAGMRLECLQVLMGHQCIEETRRYARLTDKTREEEYFRAMSKIERGNGNGDDRHNNKLATISEKEELFAQYR